MSMASNPTKLALQSRHRYLRCPKRRDANPSGRADNDGHTGANVASNPGGIFQDDKKSLQKKITRFFDVLFFVCFCCGVVCVCSLL